jgi:hypothetical protein
MAWETVNRCSVCERLVLGLEGQDWCVLPWMLAAGVTDDDVLPGVCHVRCLHDLGVARLWAEAVQDYYCLRWPQWRTGLTAGVRWRLHSSPRARRFHLWRADGRLSSFPYAALAAGGEAVELTTEVGEVGSDHSAVLLAAMGTADSGVPVPLAEVIGVLGLADRYPAAEGTLTRRLNGRRPDVPDILLARYRLALDPSCRRAARELIRGSV